MESALLAALNLLPGPGMGVVGEGEGVGVVVVVVVVGGLATKRSVLFDRDQESQIATYLMSVSPEIRKRY